MTADEDRSSTRTLMPAIGHPPGLSALAGDYDGYVLDLWGVLHEGARAFPAAGDCLLRLTARGDGLCVERVLAGKKLGHRAAAAARAVVCPATRLPPPWIPYPAGNGSLLSRC